MIESLPRWRLIKRMIPESFPMPKELTKKTNTAQITLRLPPELVNELDGVFPDSKTRQDWIRELIGYGLGVNRAKIPAT